jgi:hypothetical protein
MATDMQKKYISPEGLFLDTLRQKSTDSPGQRQERLKHEKIERLRDNTDACPANKK